MENNAQTRFCPSCGSPIEPGTTFCGQCGTKIASGQQESAQNTNFFQQINNSAPQQEQNVNPYAPQPQQNVNPYTPQPQQNVNPYAPQPQQNVNPYAQQPQQNVNPYAQQPQQDVNPYAQQPQQNVNPYTQQPQADGYIPQNNFNQTANPYAYGGTSETENLVAPKKRSKKPFVIAGVSVVGVAAVAVASVMVFNMLKPSGGPITKIADSAKNLANANNATIHMGFEQNGNEADINISYEIDKSKREVVLLMEGTADSSDVSNQTMKAVVYCKDGINRSGISTNGEEMTYNEIDEDTLNEFFDSLNQTSAEKPDWDSLLEEAKLSDYIDAEQIDSVSDALIESFENGEGKDALGITETSENGGTKYSFDIKPYKVLEVGVNTIEPLFKDKTTYNELKDQLSEYESYLNNVNIKFDISVDKSGYLSGFNFDSFGVKFNLAISNIGNTKVELSSSEIEEIKNADIMSSRDYENYLDDDYFDNTSSYLDY